jgi:hypothetical protein
MQSVCALTFAEYSGSTGEGFDGQHWLNVWPKPTHQEDGLFQSKFLDSTFDDASAEGDDSSLEATSVRGGQLRKIRTISIAPQKDICVTFISDCPQ